MLAGLFPTHGGMVLAGLLPTHGGIVYAGLLSTCGGLAGAYWLALHRWRTGACWLAPHQWRAGWCLLACPLTFSAAFLTQLGPTCLGQRHRSGLHPPASISSQDGAPQPWPQAILTEAVLHLEFPLLR